MCCTSRDTDIFISFQPGANKRLTLQIYFNQLRWDLTASPSIFIFVNISKHIYIISTTAGKSTLGRCKTNSKPLELQTKVCEDFTITEKAPTSISKPLELQTKVC